MKEKQKSDVAEKLMVRDLPIVSGAMTAGEVMDYLQKQASQFSTVHYVYVVNELEKLMGVVSIGEIFKSPKKKKVSSFMIKKMEFVYPHTHQEKVAYVALFNSLSAVPVVDRQGKLLGAVLGKTLLSIMHKEMSEDLLRLAGVKHFRSMNDNVLSLPLMKSVEHRLPWLLIGLAGGLLTAGIIGFFENTLEKNIILAAFIPLIVYMNDAVGTQMEAFVIRDTALDPKLPFFRYFMRQFVVVLMIALVASLALSTFGFFVYGSRIAAVLGLALFSGVMSSVLTGLLVPITFSRLRMDPANASGPIATIIQDLLSVLFYFVIASLIL